MPICTNNAYMNREKTTIENYFSGNVRRFRKEKQMTQEQLAEAVGISLRHMSDIERCDVFPAPDKIERIAQALQVPSYCLFLPSDLSKAELILDTELKPILEEELQKALESTLKRISH